MKKTRTPSKTNGPTTRTKISRLPKRPKGKAISASVTGLAAEVAARAEKLHTRADQLHRNAEEVRREASRREPAPGVVPLDGPEQDVEIAVEPKPARGKPFPIAGIGASA